MVDRESQLSIVEKIFATTDSIKALPGAGRLNILLHWQRMLVSVSESELSIAKDGTGSQLNVEQMLAISAPTFVALWPRCNTGVLIFSVRTKWSFSGGENRHAKVPSPEVADPVRIFLSLTIFHFWAIQKKQLKAFSFFQIFTSALSFASVDYCLLLRSNKLSITMSSSGMK